ncbi:hypothetical protein P170DRAFT_155132 [Aspergillus steynii IBT 23096]|uniref:Uncharacterized protein n=1 Tax=Aspergillus steynii IBT 23096 TaxID=1392250 RepID=A0A2I2GD64_9EURO|nr:uncharacterized protein P170DRAFT_155132 [Aspergillus steynii IBT 23096]PLB50838.1 hypothetical protein P170DRAFT_155132 [Aspergillus steynii IBT 23096]
MRFHLPPTLLLTAALSATPALAGQKVAAVWSGSTFSTVGKTGTNNFGSGFTLLNSDRDGIYNDGTPDGHIPCTFAGKEFQLEKGCLGGAWYSFRWVASQIGIPQSCEVIGPDGESVGKGDGNGDTEFFGVGIALTGACSVEFELVDGLGCGADVDGFVAHHTGWNRW